MSDQILDICKDLDPNANFFENNDQIIIMSVNDKAHIILAPKEKVYTSISDRLDYLQDIKKIRERSKKIMHEIEFLEIPYFIDSIEKNLIDYFSDKIINLTLCSLKFDKMPADYNIQGLQDFVRFVNNVKLNPNYTLIDFNSIKAGLNDIIYNEYDGHSEIVLPSYSLVYEKELGNNCTACKNILTNKE